MNQMESSIDISAQGVKAPSAGNKKNADTPSLGFVELLGGCCAQVDPTTQDEEVTIEFSGKTCDLELNMEQGGSKDDGKVDFAILGRKLSVSQIENGNTDELGENVNKLGGILTSIANPDQAAGHVVGKNQGLEMNMESKPVLDPMMPEQLVIQQQGQYPLVENSALKNTTAQFNIQHAGKVEFKHSFTGNETANSSLTPLSIAVLEENPLPGFGSAWDRLTVLSPQQTIVDAMQGNMLQAGRSKQNKPLGSITASTHEEMLSSLTDRQGMQAGDTARAAIPVPDAPHQGQLLNERVMRLEDLASRFSEQLMSMVKDNQKAMRITIEPASLGRLTVMCREENSAMVVEIHSQNEAVRDLIARQEDAIRRMMQDSNVDLQKFDVLMDHSSTERHDQRQFGAERREKRENTSGIEPASKGSGEPRRKSAAIKRNAATWIA